jgi:hypothetical protein
MMVRFNTGGAGGGGGDEEHLANSTIKGRNTTLRRRFTGPLSR